MIRLCFALFLLVAVASGASAETGPQDQPAKRARGGGKGRPDDAGKRKAALAGAASRIYVPVWLPSGSEQEWTVEAFRARVGSTEAKVRGGRFQQSPLLLFVAIDFSADLILTETAKEALATALRNSRPGLLAGLLRIPEQPMVITDPTDDFEAVIEAVKTLPMSGRAGLFEMVEVISGITSPLVRQHPVRVAVLYLTDSEISNYREDYTNPVINRSDARDLSRRFPDALIREKVSSLTNSLQRSSVPLFVVHLNYRNDTLNEAYQTGLRRLAESTGGRSVFCRSIAEIPIAIGDMVNAIQAMGMLEVDVPGSISGSFTLQLESTIGPVQHRSQFQPPR